MPIHREGWPFIALFAAANVLAFLFAPLLGYLFLPLTIWCVAFFRDPERQTPDAPGLIISPADGKLLPVVEAVPPAELGMGDAPRVRLSIFMNVFNVHVNRNPVSGQVMALSYRPGKFFNATLDKASTDNERQALHIRTADGRDLGVVQIAGLVARRIRWPTTPPRNWHGVDSPSTARVATCSVRFALATHRLGGTGLLRMWRGKASRRT